MMFQNRRNDEEEISYQWRKDRHERIRKQQEVISQHKRAQALKAELELEQRRQNATQKREQLRRVRGRKQKELDDYDTYYLQKIVKDKQRIKRLEEFGREKEYRLESFRQQELDKLNYEKELKRREDEQQCKENAERRQKQHDEWLTHENKLVESIMLRTGIIHRSRVGRVVGGTDSERLMLRYNDILDSDQDAETLTYNLKSLSDFLYKCPTAVDANRHFPQFFQVSTKTIKSIRLGEKGGVFFSRCLRVIAPNATTLDASYNNLMFRGSNAISKTLEQPQILKHLARLILRGNQLGDQSMISLAKALPSRHALQRIELSSNHVEDEGAKAIGRAIAFACPSLKVLRMDSNRIKNTGANALIKGASARKNQLKALCLQNNRITSAQAFISTSRFSQFLQI